VLERGLKRQHDRICIIIEAIHVRASIFENILQCYASPFDGSVSNPDCDILDQVDPIGIVGRRCWIFETVIFDAHIQRQRGAVRQGMNGGKISSRRRKEQGIQHDGLLKASIPLKVQREERRRLPRQITYEKEIAVRVATSRKLKPSHGLAGLGISEFEMLIASQDFTRSLFRHIPLKPGTRAVRGAIKGLALIVNLLIGRHIGHQRRLARNVAEERNPSVVAQAITEQALPVVQVCPASG
jgi:hypothetical protein